ncbi:MAG: DnaJ C-terminal domain-containing protein [Opitutaceae bacterium]
MAVDFKDYYATLGIARDASADQIKAAFRKLARQYHPDVAKDKKNAEAKFKEINEANEVLSDPVKRKKYDELGANWEQGVPSQPPPNGQRAGGQRGPSGAERGQEFHFGGTGFSDFFEQFFSGGSRYGVPGTEYDAGERPGSGAPRARRGSDIEGDILVTLEEAMHGTVRPISLQIAHPATGEAETHSFKVRIPPGATDGRRIRVPAQGEPGRAGAPAGDLYLRVRHAAHPDFSAREADIYHELEVAPWEAVLGAELVVRTLDGSLKLRLPAGTQNGQQLRVRSRGLPKGKSGERGDFHVIVMVRLPTELSPQEKTEWEKLRETSRFNPRAAHNP